MWFSRMQPSALLVFTSLTQLQLEFVDITTDLDPAPDASPAIAAAAAEADGVAADSSSNTSRTQGAKTLLHLLGQLPKLQLLSMNVARPGLSRVVGLARYLADLHSSHNKQQP